MESLTLIGEALPVFNPQNNEIIDGDVLLMSKELKKRVEFHLQKKSQIQSEYNVLIELHGTIRHEIGHVLGLGHLEPKECSDDSIMCYQRNDRRPYLKEYDKNALRYLYEDSL